MCTNPSMIYSLAKVPFGVLDPFDERSDMTSSDLPMGNWRKPAELVSGDAPLLQIQGPRFSDSKEPSQAWNILVSRTSVLSSSLDENFKMRLASRKSFGVMTYTLNWYEHLGVPKKTLTSLCRDVHIFTDGEWTCCRLQ